MNVDNFSKIIYLNRMTAMALLLRLENADIPYPISKQCRKQLVYYLSYILIDEDRNKEVLEIDYTELGAFVEDLDSATSLIKDSSIM